MHVPLTRIETSADLPTEADAVVIGGGIIGSFTAYYLAKRGLKVALVEKGLIGAEQSSRNWGWCRQQNRDARELPLATKSLALWEQFTADSGQETGFNRCGLLYLSDDPAELETWANWGTFARGEGIDTRTLSAAQAADHGKATGRQWRGGVYSPTDGIADPSRAAPAVARAIMQLGSTVHQGCAARGLEMAGGRLAGVVTEKGTIRTKIAIHSGGAWASSFCNQYGIRFPQATIRQTALAIAPGAEPIPDALHTNLISMTRRGDGGHTLSISGCGRVDLTPQMLRFSPQFVPMFLRRWRKLAPGSMAQLWSGRESLSHWQLDAPTPMERLRVLDPVPDQRIVRLTHQRATDMIPQLRGRAVTAAWSGYVDSTPDGVPGIGEVSAVPGLILAAGFSGHGFGIGPGAGHLIADIASGAAPIVDPAPYHPDRFARSAWGKVADF
jgi:glycine/D-amino acid oxidase-like deaminating enzyme